MQSDLHNRCAFFSFNALALLAMAGCSASGSGPTTTNNTTTTKDSGAPANKDAGGVTPPGDDSGTPPGDDDSGTGDDAGPAPGTPIPLPFYVSDEFVPSGLMGDSQPSRDAMTISHALTDCKTPRNTGAAGDCYTLTWNPTISGQAPAWAGLYWQASNQDWGAKPGKNIAAGAKKVSFYAAGAKGGEVVQFCSGGENDPTLAYHDTFGVKPPAVTLTTTWTNYTLDLSSASYTSVLGAFCFVETAAATTSSTFYIDDVQWEN